MLDTTSNKRQVRMNKLKTLLIGVFLIPLFANAQFWEVGVMLGASNYAGDLSPDPVTISETNPAFGAIVRANIKPTFTLKGNAYYGKISGDDKNSSDPRNKRRNLNFRSNVLDIGINAEWNIFGFEAGGKKNRFTPYLFGGASVFHFNPEAYYDINPNDDVEGNWVRLQPLGTEGQGTTKYNDREKYALTQVSIPFGFGLKYNLGGPFNLGMEAGLRKTFTDYLDDVSTTYVENDILKSAHGVESLSARLADRSEPFGNFGSEYKGQYQRGNSSTMDWYGFVGVTFTYTILPQVCFKF